MTKLAYQVMDQKPQEKFKILRFYQEHTTEPRLNQKIKRKTVTKMNIDNGGFQQQVPQRLVDRYKHMNSRNERWMMRLKVVPLA